MPSPSLMHLLLGLLTAFGWVTVALLALAPTGAWPHTGLRGNVERATLYFIVAAITRTTITDHQTRWQIAALAAAAVLFEVGRAWVSNRSNGWAGWVSSMAGVVVGAILLREIAHAYDWHWGW